MDGQIASLQHQRRATQIKVFTEWVNTYLEPKDIPVNDLLKDMSDGVRLFRLIEGITGESLGKIHLGSQKFHRIENVNKCINYLAKRFPIKGISADDIVNGNANSILALLWLIFANLQINAQQSPPTMASDTDDARNKSALLKWCQNQLVNYKSVRISDFSSSWSNGIAFNALIHRSRPDLVNFDRLNPNDALANLNSAFKIAEEKFNIPRLLDAKDVCNGKPNEDSIVIYVAYLFKTFSQSNKQPEEKIIQKTSSPGLLQSKPPISKKPFVRSPPASPSKFSAPEKQQPLSVVSMPVELIIFPDSWECNYCDFMNTPVTSICAMCYNPKPANAIKAKDKPGYTSKDDDSDDRDFTEEEEILKRPTRSKPESFTTRVSITLDSPDAIKESPPIISTSSEEPEFTFATQLPDHVPQWRCRQCGFNNPEITKICGVCFLKK